jgi:alpha-1,2-mannosyltransferase
MAAGIIMVANKSGGPLMDIILEYAGFRNGFLATDELEYAEAIRRVIFMSAADKGAIRTQARASVERFGETQFEKAFIEAIDTLL